MHPYFLEYINARIQRVFVTFDGFCFVFVLVDEGEERRSKYTKKQAIFGMPVKGHLNGVSLVGRYWHNIE